MLIANSLDKRFEDYNTQTLTSLEPEQDPFLLLPDADRITEVSTPASYPTADDGVETLGITTKVPHVFVSRISTMSSR